MDIDTSAGASTKVQSRVLYAFWGLVFCVAFLLLVVLPTAFVVNFLRAGTVPNVAPLLSQVDSTQALMALAAVGYIVYKVGMIFVVATFGKADAEAGSDLAEQTREEMSEDDDNE